MTLKLCVDNDWLRQQIVNDLISDEDDMCPNCVTPWKCNGPHLMEKTMTERKEYWRMLDPDQKAQVAIELFVELLEDVEDQKESYGYLPEAWTEKDVKAMKRVHRFLVSYYVLPSGS